MDAEQRSDQQSGKTGKRRRQREGKGDGESHVDPHEPRSVLVLHHRQQRLARTGSTEGDVEREHDAETDRRDHELQRIDAGAENLDRLLCKQGGKAARLLAEREQHRIVEHDAARDGCHQPSI